MVSYAKVPRSNNEGQFLRLNYAAPSICERTRIYKVTGIRTKGLQSEGYPPSFSLMTTLL